MRQKQMGLAAVLSAALLSLTASAVSKAPDVAASTALAVRRVIDGDTIVLADGRHVRLIGVDCPEVAHRPGERDEPFGAAARAFTARMVAGKEVTLEGDVEPFDRYRRTLAYVWFVEAGQRRLLNRRLAEEGLALALQYGRSRARLPELKEAMAEAERQGQGLWNDPDFAARFIRKHHFVDEFGALYLARLWLSRQRPAHGQTLAQAPLRLAQEKTQWRVMTAAGKGILRVSKKGGEITPLP